MENIIIAEANPEDAKGIAILLGELGYPNDEQFAVKKIASHQQPNYKLLVARLENSTVGYIALHTYDTLHWEKPLGRINSFCVSASYRGKGVGSALLQSAEAYFKENDCLKIEVSSNNRRTNAHSFYLKCDYKEMSRFFVKFVQ